MRLIKSLYGLKQTPRCWNHKLDTFLKSIGFNRCYSDNCLYVKDGFFALIYVDDILLFTDDDHKMADVKSKLMTSFRMHDLGALEFIVGIRVTRDRPNKLLYLDQESYCKRILEKFNMSKANSVNSPINQRLVRDGIPDSTNYPYRQVVGSLMYLMVGTRPDIALACSELSRYLEKPTVDHVIAVKRVLRYLIDTSGLRLCFNGNEPINPVAFADADYANDLEKRRSTSGYFLQMCGSSIIWKSKIQPVTALSTTEAEYYSAAFCCHEICWVQECLQEIGYHFAKTSMIANQDYLSQLEVNPIEILQYPTTMHEDNMACISIAKNLEKYARTKHIEVKYQFVRDLVEHCKVKLEYIPTKCQIADIFTKPLPPSDFIRHRNLLGLS